MSWLKKTSKVLAKQEAEQKARVEAERQRKLEEGNEIARQMELRWKKIEKLEAEWLRLEISKIIEDIKVVIFPEYEISEAVARYNENEAWIIQWIYHLEYRDLPEYQGYWSPASDSDFFIILYKDRVEFGKNSSFREEFSLDGVPDAEVLREKIDQYLAERLRKEPVRRLRY